MLVKRSEFGGKMAEYSHHLPEELEREIRKRIRLNEKNELAEFAAKSADGLRRSKENKKEDIRATFSRDADRIVHTRAYARYIDKTQVFFFVDNDHITHRVLHVQMVSKIGRTIGRALGLNEDLIEAIAIGHDIGHTAFGHAGEECLSSLCIEHGIGRFCHNVQSVQFLDGIERRNLTLQVLDGILSHNGEVHEQIIKPNFDKDWDELDSEFHRMKYDSAWSEPKKRIVFPPMTMEGCVVRVADTIAYVGRDIDDAFELGLLDDLELIPEKIRKRLGTDNADIINSLIADVVEHSYGHDHISYSREASDALKELKEFNYKNIYNNDKLTREKNKICGMYKALFEKFSFDLKNNQLESKIYEHFCDLRWIDKEYLENTKVPEKVRDYMAGMTDRYFEEQFKTCTLPVRRHTFKEK